MNHFTRIRDFHASRRAGVGSSDIPTLAGLTLRYGQTPLKLFDEKTGRTAPWAGNEKTWWGKVHENSTLYRYVRDRYDEETAARFLASKLRGRSLGELRVLTECRHPDYRFALAHADLLMVEEPHIAEAKSHSYHAAARKDDPDYGYDPEDLSQNGLPAGVFLQVQWQLLCYGVGDGTVAALIDTNRYSEYGPVRADSKVQSDLLALAERFWWHVTHDTPPAPVNWADVQRLFPVPRQTTAMVGGEQELGVREMKRLKGKLDAAKKRIKGKEDDLKNAIGLLIGENSVLTSAEGEVLARSWPGAGEDVSLKKIREQEPELYDRLKPYITPSAWRTLKY